MLASTVLEVNTSEIQEVRRASSVRLVCSVASQEVGAATRAHPVSTRLWALGCVRRAQLVSRMTTTIPPRCVSPALVDSSRLSEHTRMRWLVSSVALIAWLALSIWMVPRRHVRCVQLAPIRVWQRHHAHRVLLARMTTTSIQPCRRLALRACHVTSATTQRKVPWCARFVRKATSTTTKTQQHHAAAQLRPVLRVPTHLVAPLPATSAWLGSTITMG